MRINYKKLDDKQINKIIKSSKGFTKSQKAAAEREKNKRVAQKQYKKREQELQKAFAKKRVNKRATIQKQLDKKQAAEYFKQYKAEKNKYKKEQLFLKFYDLSDSIDIIEDFLNDKKELTDNDVLNPQFAYEVWQLVGDNQYSILVKYVVLTGTMPDVFIKTQYSGQRFIPKTRDYSQVFLYDLKGKFIKEL